MLVSMEFYGEAMYLVLYLCEYMKELTVCLQGYAERREAVEQFVGTVTVVLGQSCNGDIEIQLVLYHLSDDLHLTFSAVSDDKVG